MKTYFSIDNQQEFYTEFQQQIGSFQHFDDFERCIEIAPRIGIGKIRSFQFSSGLELHIQEYLTQEPIALEVDIQYSSLGIGWIVCGHSNFALDSQELCLQPQQSVITYSNHVRGNFELVAKKKIVMVELNIGSYLRRSVAAKQKEQLPNLIKNSIDRDSAGFLVESYTRTPAVNVALHQILSCPYGGLTKKLYLESKAIELLALNLEILSNERPTPAQVYQPKQDEIERLHYAREILIANMSDPPSLHFLARQVGLNEYKLKQGFRHLFDTTVFGYLHHHRMERSYSLLKSGGMKVTDVAQTVGYSNLGHFAAAFRQKFGVNPSVFKSNGS